MIILPESDCITFNGYKDYLGYISFQFRHEGSKKNILAHRAAYILHYKIELSTQDVIMHTCDNPCCINHEHLIKGTHDDNVQDRVRKGRSATGERNGRYIHGDYAK